MLPKSDDTQINVLTKTRNEPKRPETSQNELKPAETSQNNPSPAEMTPPFPKKNVKRSKTTQNFKIGEICNFLLAFVFQISTQKPKFGHFGPKSINFLILTKFRMYSILDMLISNLSFVFENYVPKCINLGILGQKV